MPLREMPQTVSVMKGHDIQMQVREKIDRNQKDYFLREQIKAIQAELGEDDDDEIREYEKRIEAKKMPDDVKEKLYKELTKLAKTPFGAAESTVLRPAATSA